MVAWMVALAVGSALAAPPSPGVEGGGWQATLERVAPAVVSIEVTATRDFDTEDASNSVGTGFVVDAARGIVLTNRHMVHAGPVTARAVFLDNEEATLVPIYRDPVHDFGFYQFDPSEIAFMDVVSLPLAPEAARVGLEIRVVGNDAGEKLSILDGTLARLDRNAPFYGRNSFNDFNTFYYQAASNTSGGSSGSPVIDVQGRAVALNAGGRVEAASSFYLPLHRVVRALALIQQGEPIARGTLQTTFLHRSYDDLARLGLSDPSEAAARAARSGDSGLLTVESVVPAGPAHGVLRPGDILLRVDGLAFPGFLDLESHLDDRVGQTVEVEVERLGERITATLSVGDLHAITPDRFVEISRGIFHPTSYQQARNHDVPVAGVYVAASGYMFGAVPEGAILTHLDGEPVLTLDAFARAVAQRPDGARMRVRYVPISEIQRAREVVVTVDRTWFSARTCVRDDTTGTWRCTVLPEAPPRDEERPASLPLPDTGRGLARKLAPALVMVEFDIPYSTAGVSGQNFLGAGVVVDAGRGLILVDRDTVPTALGDLTVTFAGTVKVPAEVVWLHPQHNAAFIQYDPADVGEIDVAEIALAPRDPARGDTVHVVGRDRSGAVVSDRVEVDDVDTLSIGTSGTPRFRDVNVEVADLAKVERTVGGVVVDRKGRMLALWASYYFPDRRDRFFYGLPVSFLRGAITALRAGDTPDWRTTGIEWRTVSLADARERGLSDARVAATIRHDPERLRVLEVVRIDGTSPAAGVVRRTDLLVVADGSPVTRMTEVEAWSQRDSVPVVLLRDGAEVAVDLHLHALDGQGIRRVVNWGGMLLHDAHPAVAAQQEIVPEGAYIAWYWYGSPASRDGVRPTRRVVAVGQTPTPNLDAFLAAVKAIEGRTPTVLTLEDLDEVQTVRAIEPDPAYWPLELLEWVDGRWTRSTP